MADYAALAAKSDAQVDTRLGDSIFYKREADAQFVEIKGFLQYDDVDAAGFQDSARQPPPKLLVRKQVRELLKNDRIQIPGRDGTYRPVNRIHARGGRYWLANLQAI